MERRRAREYPRDATIHALFEAQVQRDAGRAWRVVFEDAAADVRASWTRGRTSWRTTCAAGRGARGARGRCAWSARWSWWWALLGILKAGGAYVPLDPLPGERLALHAGGHAARRCW